MKTTTHRAPIVLPADGGPTLNQALARDWRWEVNPAWVLTPPKPGNHEHAAIRADGWSTLVCPDGTGYIDLDLIPLASDKPSASLSFRVGPGTIDTVGDLVARYSILRDSISLISHCTVPTIAETLEALEWCARACREAQS